MDVAEDGVEFAVTNDGQDWCVAWHPPSAPPPGTAHGSTGVCLVGDQVVLVCDESRRWGLPGGRPDPRESWAATLRREVQEEACATVTACRLLGFSRGECLRGPEAGLVLVRALWLAEVRLEPWRPRFEMVERRLVPLRDAFDATWIPPGYGPMYRRTFAEAAAAARPHRPAGRSHPVPRDL